MNGIKDIRITYGGRVWELVRATWPNGTAALFLRNPRTGEAIPASLQVSNVIGSPNEAHVPDAAGLLHALEASGIVRPADVSARLGALTVWDCQVVHPALVRSRAPRITVGHNGSLRLFVRGAAHDGQGKTETFKNQGIEAADLRAAARRIARRCREIIQGCLREEEWTDCDQAFTGIILEELKALETGVTP